MPRVLNCRDGEHPGAVYIGRQTRTGRRRSKFANPFRIERDGTREECVAKFEAYLLARPELLEAARRELRGRDLACWCAPELCHGHVLLRYANE
jgi:hypothetical protein